MRWKGKCKEGVTLYIAQQILKGRTLASLSAELGISRQAIHHKIYSVWVQKTYPKLYMEVLKAFKSRRRGGRKIEHRNTKQSE